MAPTLTPTQSQRVERLCWDLRERGVTEPVASAFGRVPRHWFLDQVYLGESSLQGAVATPISPETDEPELLDRLYVDNALCIRRVDGRCTSSTTQPSLMANMLLDAELAPGMSVLEIGTATGWNAAILAELVGPDGHVVTVEYDAEVAGAARRRLAAYGYDRWVDVRAGDGALGAADAAPYDAILVTVGCPDVPLSWLDQLRVGGLLQLPFALPDGGGPMLCLRRDPSGWSGKFRGWVWFVNMRGAGIAPWPEPFDPSEHRDLGPASRQRVETLPLPWAAQDTRMAQEFAWWLVARGHVQQAIRWPASQSGQALGLYEPATRQHPAGVAVLLDCTITGCGNPMTADRLMALAHQWQREGAFGPSDYRVEALPSGPCDEPLVILKPHSMLVMRRP